MVSSFTTNKNFEQPSHGSDVDTWDVPVNADWAAIDNAFGGSTLLNSTGLSGNQTLTTTQYQPLSLLISGTPTAAVTYVVPSGVGGQWVFQNGTSGGFTVGIKSNAGGATITCPAGSATLVSCDGSSSGMRLSISTPPAAAGSTQQIQFNNSGVLAGSAALLWDGTTLFSTGLNVGGNVFLGVNSGSTLTIEGTAIAAPNNLNIATNALFLNTTTKQLGINTTSVGSNSITAAGSIQSLSGGFVFPDNTIQTTAAQPTVPASPTSSVQFNNAGVFGGLANFEYDGVNLLTVPNITMTGTLALTGGPANENKGTDIASATTTNIGAATGNFVHVTGTTTITGLGTVQAGTERTVEFTGILTLTYNATSLILPTAANITTAAGDTAIFRSEGSGNWRCISYQRANGIALSSGIAAPIYIFTATNPSGTTALPADNTIPQITEGNAIAAFATSFTALNAAHRVRVTISGTITCTAVDTGAVAIFIDGASNAVSAQFLRFPDGQPYAFCLRYEVVLSAGAHTYAVRAGSNSGNGMIINGASGSVFGGGVNGATMTIEELLGP